MASSRSTFRPAHLLAVLLFIVSAIATFYMGLAFALGDFWGTERGDADNASGASALILVFAVTVAVFSGIGARTDGRNANRAMITCLIVGLIAAVIPWIWTI